MNQRWASNGGLIRFAVEGVPFALGLVLAWAISGDGMIRAAAETMFVMIALLATAGSLIERKEEWSGGRRPSLRPSAIALPIWILGAATRIVPALRPSLRSTMSWLVQREELFVAPAAKLIAIRLGRRPCSGQRRLAARLWERAAVVA
jgi:hypothetical protein